MSEMKVRISKYDFELSRAGIKAGDIVEGIYDPKNGSVRFTGKGSLVSCCIAYLGVNCELLPEKKTLPIPPSAGHTKN